MKISAKENGFFDLTEYEEINDFFESIQFNEDKEIILDLSNCLLGYETAELLDKILIGLYRSNSPRQLVIIINYQFLSENTMFEWLFRNSEFWQDFDDASKIKNIILEKIKEKYNVELKLGVQDGK
jgi:hypothetical protein